MSFRRNMLLIIALFFGLTSCLMTEQVKVMQVEVMKPGSFIFPKNISKVAIFKRDLYQSDTSFFRYYNIYGSRIDSTIKPSNLSNHCVDAVSEFFKRESYFQEITNYRDSLNSFWTDKSILKYPEKLTEKTNADIYIFLDFFKFYNTTISSSLNYVNTAACLSWTINLKNDTVSYIYNQVDTLVYEGSQFSSFNLESNGHGFVLMDAAKYLGESFGKKIIPSWVPVERMYYTSNNQDMLQAEKYALSNEWLKAAEIWKRETKCKNLKIVTKSCYNMALAAEMEGQIDVAIDWLIRSYSTLPKNNKDHQANCQRYINVLALRMKEIKQLEKQVRNIPVQ